MESSLHSITNNSAHFGSTPLAQDDTYRVISNKTATFGYHCGAH